MVNLQKIIPDLIEAQYKVAQKECVVCGVKVNGSKYDFYEHGGLCSRCHKTREEQLND